MFPTLRTVVRRLPGMRLPAWERGATAVEVALVAPVFLLLVIGTIDLGRAAMTYHMATEGAREGARRGIVLAKWDTTATPPRWTLSAQATAEIEAAARRQTAGLEQPLQVVAQMIENPAPAATYQGWYLQVRVSSTYNPVAGQLLKVGSIPITRTSVMHVP